MIINNTNNNNNAYACNINDSHKRSLRPARHELGMGSAGHVLSLQSSLSLASESNNNEDHACTFQQLLGVCGL